MKIDVLNYSIIASLHRSYSLENLFAWRFGATDHDERWSTIVSSLVKAPFSIFSCLGGFGIDASQYIFKPFNIDAFALVLTGGN